MRNILSIDDTLDVFAVHGIGGIFGTLMIAIFGYTSFVTQLSGLIIVGIFTVIVTIISETKCPVLKRETTRRNGKLKRLGLTAREQEISLTEVEQSLESQPEIDGSFGGESVL